MFIESEDGLKLHATFFLYDKSDLDLLILINDDNGWKLSCTFIQDDLQVGHDIYCTNWEGLEYDAGYEHPNISKLMDAKIVYCADEKYKERLEVLRQKAKNILEAPFSREDYEKAEKVLKETEHFYMMAIISDEHSKVYEYAGGVVYYIENANAMVTGISRDVDIDKYDALDCYNSENLNKTANAYDNLLNEYHKEYVKAGISEKRYPDIDSFVDDYQIKQ